MPDRIIRDELLESSRWLGLKDDADRLAFVALLLKADDFGNCEAGLFKLTRLWDGVIGDCNEQRAAKVLQELVEAELVALYEIDNPNARPGSRFEPPKLRYLHIHRFRQRIRYPRAAHPMPPWQADDYEPDVTSYEWQKKVRPAILARDGHRCASCGSPDSLTVDHIVPLRDGGKSVPENLITLCRPCNMKKGVKQHDVEKYQRLAQQRNVATKSPKHRDDVVGDVVKMSEEKRSEAKRSELPICSVEGVDTSTPSAENGNTPPLLPAGLSARTWAAWKAHLACKGKGLTPISEQYALVQLAKHADPDSVVSTALANGNVTLPPVGGWPSQQSRTTQADKRAAAARAIFGDPAHGTDSIDGTAERIA